MAFKQLTQLTILLSAVHHFAHAQGSGSSGVTPAPTTSSISTTAMHTLHGELGCKKNPHYNVDQNLQVNMELCEATLFGVQNDNATPASDKKFGAMLIVGVNVEPAEPEVDVPNSVGVGVKLLELDVDVATVVKVGVVVPEVDEDEDVVVGDDVVLPELEEDKVGVAGVAVPEPEDAATVVGAGVLTPEPEEIVATVVGAGVVIPEPEDEAYITACDENDGTSQWFGACVKPSKVKIHNLSGHYLSEFYTGLFADIERNNHNEIFSYDSSNDTGSYQLHTYPCDPYNLNQKWTVIAAINQFRHATHNNLCLYDTFQDNRAVTVAPCNVAEPGQQWIMSTCST
ncbi:hypothetical protein THRCLA_23256 [Thraustotheca clavata]|uniref:Uncharacterized protein n=1 Tax=Thraustotheca clavata TaxID=74557 RepID=A0A1V9Y8H6_9STRA|nr:hypothetical protein THRCLA_23256 [Thraustotheca clavata]